MYVIYERRMFMKKESGKWKTTLKMAAGSVGFLAGLCVVLILAGRFLCRKSNADIYDTTAVRTKDAEVKNEVKDTIDVLFLGDSECYSSFNPLQMFAEHGYTSFICGTSAQRMCDSYAILQAAFETQTPEVVVLETNCLFRSVKSKGDSKDYVLDRLSDHVEIFKNHSRWKDAFVSTNSLTKKKNEKNRGFIKRSTVKPYEGGAYMHASEERKSMDADAEKYLLLMKEYCESHGAKLVLVSSPSPKNWTYAKHNSVSDWAQENAVTYEDLNLNDALGIDWASDTKDGGDHLNFEGAKKVSAYVGNWLSEAYGLNDKRNNPDYKHWEEDSVEYAAARN